MHLSHVAEFHPANINIINPTHTLPEQRDFNDHAQSNFWNNPAHLKG